MAANSELHNHIFYNNVTNINQTDTGSTWIMSTAGNISTVNLDIICDGTFSLQVLGSNIDKDHFHPYPYLKLTYTFEEGQEYVSDANYFYQIDTTGIDYLQIKLISLSGTLTCRGKCVG